MMPCLLEAFRNSTMVAREVFDNNIVALKL